MGWERNLYFFTNLSISIRELQKRYSSPSSSSSSRLNLAKDPNPNQNQSFHFFNSSHFFSVSSVSVPLTFPTKALLKLYGFGRSWRQWRSTLGMLVWRKERRNPWSRMNLWWKMMSISVQMGSIYPGFFSQHFSLCVHLCSCVRQSIWVSVFRCSFTRMRRGSVWRLRKSVLGIRKGAWICIVKLIRWEGCPFGCTDYRVLHYLQVNSDECCWKSFILEILSHHKEPNKERFVFHRFLPAWAGGNVLPLI